MSILPALTSRDVLAALKKAGFVEHHQRGSHLYVFHPGKRHMTCVPIHSGDLPRGTVRGIIKQSGLTVEEFVALL